MAETDFWLLLGTLIAIVVLFLIAASYFDYKVSKLRKENKLLRRVLEDYFQLEDEHIHALGEITREADRANLPTTGWYL